MAGSENGGKRRDKENHYRCAALLHPLRSRILQLAVGGAELSLGQMAASLDQEYGRIAYHVRVLVKRDALKVVSRRRPAPPLYRWSPNAKWVRRMLGEIDELGPKGG